MVSSFQEEWRLLRGNVIEDILFINHYDNNSTVVETVSIDSDIIRNFSICLRSCEREIKKINIDSLEKNFLSIKNLFFLISTTLNDYHLMIDYIGKEKIETFFKQWKKYDLCSSNEYGKPLWQIIKQLYNKEIYNDLKNDINKRILENENDLSIIVTKNRFDLLNQNDKSIKMVTPENFLSNEYKCGCEHLIFIGTPALFPVQFHTIFFGKYNVYVNYDYMYNKFKNINISDFTSNKISRIFEKVSNHTSGANLKINMSEKNDDYSDFEDSISELPFISRRKIDVMDNKSGLKYDTYLLTFVSGNYGYFPLKAKLNVFTDNNTLIERKITELKKNTVVVFRETGQREILEEKAASIVGKDRYNHYWNEINYFRMKLKGKLDLIGIEGIKTDLNVLGIHVISDLTIRNWLDDTIKPQNFLTILEQYLKIENSRAKKIEAAASSIKSAHIKAGRELTAELTHFLFSLPDQIIDLIRGELKEKGNTNISSIDYGAIHFEIVENIDNEIHQIPAQNISEIFER